jgi:hypothetical protein
MMANCSRASPQHRDSGAGSAELKLLIPIKRADSGRAGRRNSDNYQLVTVNDSRISKMRMKTMTSVHAQKVKMMIGQNC